MLRVKAIDLGCCKLLTHTVLEKHPGYGKQIDL